MQGLLAAGVPMALALDSGSVRIVTICTGDGYRQITLDAENGPIAPSDHETCPDCCLAGCAPIALAAESWPAFPPVSRIAKFSGPADAGTGSSAFLSPHSRAPPSELRQPGT